jgi:hypothetical protein
MSCASAPLMIMARIFLVFVTAVSICEASSMRGANRVEAEPQDDSLLRQRQLQLTSEGIDCPTELSLDVVCVGDCNFTARPSTCESKMFLYHGGPCRNSASSASRATFINIDVTDTAADCIDLHEGPPSELGDEAFVVITDVYNPSLTASQQVMVGNYFWTDFEDMPTGMAGWSDTQNITIYRSQTTTYDNMLQTMLFYAPCVETPLELLDSNQPVQLVALGMDPKIKADFDLQVTSLTDRTWKLTAASVALNVPPFFQGLPVMAASRSSSVNQHKAMNVPMTIEMDRNTNLTIVATATAVTTTGTAQCTVTTLVSSPFV